VVKLRGTRSYVWQRVIITNKITYQKVAGGNRSAIVNATERRSAAGGVGHIYRHTVMGVSGNEEGETA